MTAFRFDNVQSVRQQNRDHAEQEFLRRQEFKSNRKYIVMGWVALLISGCVMVWAAVQAIGCLAG